MAIAFVQTVFDGTATTSGNNRTFAPTATAAIGDLLVAVVREVTPRTVTGVTDSQGNTWVIDSQNIAGTNGIAVISSVLAHALTTSDTVTVAFGADPTGTTVTCCEYSGIAASWTDKVAGNFNQASTSTPVTGTTATTAQANELLVGTFVWSTARTVTAGSGYTLRTTTGSTQRGFEDRIVAATGTYQAGLTLSGVSANYGAVIVTYKAAAARVTKTHATDALIGLTSTKTHSANATILKTSTKVHTADGVVLGTAAQTHGADAVIQKSATAVQGADAVVMGTGTLVHGADAVIPASLSTTHQVDAHIRATSVLSQSTDALVVGRTTKTHGADAQILQVGALVPSHNTDALILRTSTKTHEVDGLIRISGAVTHDTDALLSMTLVATHGTDALVEEVLAAQHSVDAYVVGGAILHHGADAHVVDRTSLGHGTDSHIVAQGSSVGGAFTSLLCHWVILYKMAVSGDARDDYGNPVDTQDAGTVVRARVEPIKPTELDISRQSRVSLYTVFLDPDVDVEAVDQIEWEGRRHDVIGRPPIFAGRFGAHHIEMTMRLNES